MEALIPILIVGFIVLGIYRVFELFVRRKERMAIIERLGEQIKLSEANVDLHLPLFQKSESNWALRISLLLIGLGTGLIFAYFINFSLSWTEYWNRWGGHREILYFACLAMFGGIGLLSAYFIEQKHKN